MFECPECEQMHAAVAFEMPLVEWLRDHLLQYRDQQEEFLKDEKGKGKKRDIEYCEYLNNEVEITNEFLQEQIQPAFEMLMDEVGENERT